MQYLEFQEGKQKGRAELASCILNMVLEGKTLQDIQRECESILQWEEDEDETQ